ncbi:MAG TPA: DUF4105 domain-containing protein [Longimicrobiales bacterium]
MDHLNAFSRASSSRPRRLARALAVLGLAAMAAGCVGARPKPAEPGLGPAAVPASAPSPGPAADNLRVYLMTFGPGAEVYEHFGHTAIWVHDLARGTDQAYNYGMFDFRQAHFFRRFIEGKMLYWMQGFDAQLFADAYIQQDRSVWVQELALTPAQREALRQFLVWNERPENRFYPYDYYRDGCATRVRDALDRVLGGAIRAQTESVTSGSTYRSHSLQLVEDDPWSYTGLSLGLARPTDRRISLWEEMFLPLKLRETLRRVTVPTADGRRVPLVASERTIYSSTRPAEPTVPPERPWMYALAGSAVALVLAGLAEVARRGRSRRGPASLAGVARALLAGLGALWTLVVGVFGLLLIFLWTLTAHVTSYDNENVLQFNALTIAFVVLLPALTYGRAWAARPARLLALTIAALSLLGLLLKLTPWFWQVNAPIIALALPANLGLAWAVWRLSQRDLARQA